MIEKLKKLFCTCSSDIKYKSSCCTNTEVMDIEVEVKQLHKQDIDTSLSCFGFKLVRSVHNTPENNINTKIIKND